MFSDYAHLKSISLYYFRIFEHILPIFRYKDFHVHFTIISEIPMGTIGIILGILYIHKDVDFRFFGILGFHNLRGIKYFFISMQDIHRND
jgi:multidrug efflux pump subunit AcrB